MNTSFFRWLIVLLISVLSFDIFVGYINDDLFHKITKGIYGSINRCFSEDYQLLVLGSSTAQSHYNPDILSKITGKRTFNGGVGGYGIFLNYAILNERISSCSPDILILDIAPNVIADPFRYEKLDKLSPYYDDLESFKEIIELDNRYISVLNQSSSIKYNSSLYYLFRIIFKRNNAEENGYVPINKKISGPLIHPMSAENCEPDTIQLKYFEKLIRTCEMNSIELYVIVSPSYIPYDPNNLILRDYQDLYLTHNVKYFNYSQHEQFLENGDLFSDQIHLNKFGANLFTSYIAKLIASRLPS